MSDFVLPAGFEDLAVWRDRACPTEQARHNRRLAGTLEDLQQFYDAMTSRIEEIFAHLNSVPMDELDPATENLLLLTLSLQESALAVENLGQLVNPSAWPLSKVEFFSVGAAY